MEVVLWSGWGREFADEDEGRILGRLERGLRPGAILLLHDNDERCPPGTGERTRRILPALAGRLAERGLEAVTLDRLLAGSGARR